MVNPVGAGPLARAVADPAPEAPGEQSSEVASAPALPPPFAGIPGWRAAFGALLVAQFTSMVAFGMALPFLPLYVQRLGVVGEGNAAQ